MVKGFIELLTRRWNTPEAIARRTRNLEQRRDEYGIGDALLHIEQQVLNLSPHRANRPRSVARVECRYGFDLQTNVSHLAGIPTPNIGGTIVEVQTGLFHDSLIDSPASRSREKRHTPIYSIAVTEKGILYGRYGENRPVRLGKARSWVEVKEKASRHASFEAGGDSRTRR